jgi:hypothetical protein
MWEPRRCEPRAADDRVDHVTAAAAAAERLFTIQPLRARAAAEAAAAAAAAISARQNQQVYWQSPTYKPTSRLNPHS